MFLFMSEQCVVYTKFFNRCDVLSIVCFQDECVNLLHWDALLHTNSKPKLLEIHPCNGNVMYVSNSTSQPP